MKNQVKKSLSLLMAVLMILSCWVWVAPEKASAVATPYYIKLISNVTDTGDEDGSWVYVTYKDNNGQGTQTTDKEVGSYGQRELSGNDQVVWEGSIDGWPSQIKFKMKLGTGRSERHENFRLYIGSSAENCNTQILKTDNYGFNGGTNTCTLNVTGTAPVFTEITAMSATDAAITKLPNGSSVTSTVTVTGGRDQYGVDWKAAIPTSGFTYSLKYTNSAGTEAALGSTYGKISGTTNTATATFYDDVQTLFENSLNGKVYAYATYNNKSTKSTPINLTFPTYDVTFDANGGKIGTSDSDAKDTDKTTGIKYKGIIGKSPAFRTKAGFDFVAFYSDKNPDATGLTASFSGTKFVDNETTVGTQGDTTYYAAWKAKKIYATFLTADNQLIGTVEGRYNNNYTAANMYNGQTGLNTAVKNSYEGNKLQFDSNDAPIYKDGSTNYTFAGWKIIEAYDESLIDEDEDTVLKGDVTFQAVYTKADAKTYTVSFEDGNGTVTSSKSGYKYRDAVTGVPASASKNTDDKYNYEFIGWAKKLEGVKYFAVDANDCDEDGVKLSYTSKDAAEFIVKGDATYVPVFRMINREYEVSFTYKVDGGAEKTISVDGYHWGDSISLPETIKDNYTAGGYRYYITGWNGSALADLTVNGDLTLVASYGAGIPAEYVINFYDMNGNLLNGDNNIYTHNSKVTAPGVDAVIDTEESLYNFVAFKDKNGNTYSTTATADADYYAEYTKKDYANLHFYNYDGTLIYELIGKENSLFVGEAIPAYKGETPVKAEDAVGTYTFNGWVNGNGEEVKPGVDVFEGHTYLTADFTTNYKEYTVKFLNDVLDDEGNLVVVDEKTYHYGDPIVIPADPTKAEDKEYKYDFRAWTPEVSEVCYGNATYTATYRRTPQYYSVTWYDDVLNVLTVSNYQYNAKINQATISLEDGYIPSGYQAPADGNKWVLDYWAECDASGNLKLDAEGNHIKFVRGQRMTDAALYYYPVFKQETNVLTVTFYKEDGTTELGKAKIPYGGSIEDYAEAFAEKARKISDEQYHYIINEWVNINGGETVTTVTADVSVKATYTAEAHNKVLYEVVAEPTCNVPGYGHFKCAADECTEIDYNVAIAPIADEGDPTGQIYVGTTKWTLKDYTDGIDYSEVTYVGPNTQLIVNAEDTNIRSKPWNLEGKLSRGVGKIEYFVADGKIADASTITEWAEIYNYEAFRQDALNEVLKENNISLLEYNGYNHGTTEQRMKKAEIDRTVDTLLSIYNANATGVVSNLNLEDGKTYVLYIRVSDREGNGEVNTCVFSSGTISYGSEAAVIEVSGDGHGTKFCDEANIRITDDADGIKVYLDGEEVEAYTNPGTTSANGTFVATFKTDVAGVHTVTAIDKHGNKTVKTFEIKGNHTFRNYTTAATCDNAGSRYDLCTLCGVKANETVLPALGHSYTVNFVDKAADCINDGYRTYVCDNNCGTTLVLYPTDDAATLAQAKKLNESNEWVALTADDLKELKATGVHTYAKAVDADGNETAEDAWIIDKAATCTEQGSKHKDCTKCGETVTEPIPVDTVNGHKFYREKVTLEPTCTEKGEKTKTCRYCGHIELVEYIDALGHTDGEYRVITPATCETAGSQILTCAVCGEDIGEAKPIPALGHAYKAVGEIYQDAEDGKWYQNYVCKNDPTHTKKEVVEGYQPPVAATVAFMNGDVAYATVSGYVGDTISASEIAGKPVKAETATHIYTFSHWADAEGKEVTFPIEVEGDATYYAVYTEKFVNYTITYYKEDGTTEFKKTGYLHNDDKVALADGPAKAETSLVTYKFVGWSVIGSDPEVVYTTEATIDGANINLKAKYEAVKRQYAVTYAYSKNDILETFAVEAGTAARDCAIVPEKKNDSKYHYEFKAWNKAEQLKSVESNIYTTPDFEAINHEYTVTVKTAATCITNRIDTYTCACGYTYDKEIANTALEHNWGEPVYDEETGKNTITCQNEGCGITETDTRTFTVKFFTEAGDTQALKTISYIAWGTTIDATRLPATPAKESTATTDYTFKGWAVEGTTDIIDFAEFKIKQDYNFVAVFEGTARIYSVVFAYDAHNIIKTIPNVKAGDDLEVTFDKIPEKAFDATYHYTFSGWSGYEEGKLDITIEDVQSNLYILADFSKAKHEYTPSTLGEATCTNGAGTRYTCTCGKYYDITGKPLPHNFVETDRKEATPYSDGYIRYKCETCSETKEEILKYNDNTIEIKVYVEHNGAPESGVKVELRNEVDGSIVYATTNANGYANFVVDQSGAYNCFVFGKIVTLAKEGDGYVGFYSYTDQASCTCACHRDNIWGAIFRFFHKIIKLFTGEFKCCTNPDPMYG